MIRTLLLLFLAFSFATNAFSQTTATDFTATDCAGNSHHLFSELDSGKVVVIAWVMPCATCVGPALAAFTAVQNYSVDHPEKVLFYLVDDFANTPCNTLKSWAANNGMTGKDVFSDPVIDMDDYGTYGMPKVVVLGGGTNHHVFYNKNYNADDVGQAIGEALTATAVSPEPKVDFELNVYPNPARDFLDVSFRLPLSSDVGFDIVNTMGLSVGSIPEKENQPEGQHELRLDISSYASGVYFLRMRTGQGTQLVQFNISR